MTDPVRVDSPVFVDTNLLILARDSAEPERQRRAAEWMARLWETGMGRLSLQVLREYYVAVTERLSPGLPEEEAREDVWALRAWHPLPGDLELMEEAWELEDRCVLTFRDAMIVAAARRMDCPTLLSDRLEDGRELAGVVVLDPFLHGPRDLGAV